MAPPLISVDVEASGPVPGQGDMISFAAVVVEPGLGRRFHSGIIRPVCPVYSDAAYASIGMTRDHHLDNWQHSYHNAMSRLMDFVLPLMAESGKDRCIMLSDNPGFDFMWVNWALLNNHFKPVFGHSARRIGDVYAGLKGNSRNTQGWKRLRVTPHTHDPLDDCVGNAEAWLEMWRRHAAGEKF